MSKSSKRISGVRRETIELIARITVVGVIAFLSGRGVILSDDSWPQWRGPHRTGVVEGEAWPSTLGEEQLKRRWRVELGEGYPGPIVSGGRVFTVESGGKRVETVRAFDQKTGESIWERTWDGSMKVPFFAAKNGSWVKSTPATDGRSLLVGGMQEILVSLDVETGKENWRIDFADRLKSDRPSFGFVCSPLIDGDFAFLQAGGGIVKIDIRSGEVVWHVGAGGDGMNDGAFSSPIVTLVSGEQQLVVQGRASLKGFNPTNGQLLWQQAVKAFRGMNIVTPVAFEDSFFTTTYGGRARLWSIGKSGEQFEVENLWDNKLQGYMCTPVVVDGFAYFHLRNQRAACVDLNSGEIAWVTDERFGKYWSLVAQGDRLLALDEEGELILFRANPKRFELIDRRKIAKSETWGHLTVVDGELFVRELDGLSAWDWKPRSELAGNN
jgi:outer membrane protein assembly factor BamB